MIRKLAPVVLLICLSVSCASCKDRVSWDWEPRPLAGDSKTQSIINEHGEIIRCEEPQFDYVTCFEPDNIAELSAAIDNLDVGKKAKRQLRKIFSKIYPAKRQAR